jgi:hypothetical protein
MQGEDGETEEVVVDLSKVETNDVDPKKLNRKNEYEFVTPTGKNVIVFKLLTHGDEKKIDVDVKAMNRLNKGGASQELTTRYRYMIKSVDGKEDKKDIRNFVDNYFLARDSRAFREHIKNTQPDVDLNYVLESGEEVAVPIGLNFFWPDA